MKSRIIDITIQAEVWYEEVADKSYGEDSDGNRGTTITITERIPISVAILELVPQEAVGWLKAKAIEEFERQY